MDSINANQMQAQGFTPAPATDEELQRTEQWHEDRRGRFTGSKIKDLMGCTRSTSKMGWDRPEKIVDFSETAIKYIYSRARERQTGKTIATADNFQVAYGRAVEPFVFQKITERLNGTIEKKGFVEVPMFEGILGASCDNALNDIPLEIKAAMNFETEYIRTENEVDEKHQDFWQMQTEMLALVSGVLYYVTAEPDADPVAIVKGEIEWDGDVIISKVHASPIHQSAIKHRANIGDEAIRMWMTNKGSIHMRDCVKEIASNYEFI